MTIEKFFSTARERYSILIKRRAGLPKPWSADPIFNSYRFCNVDRESDRTTEWFRENIRDKIKEDPEKVLLAIVAFRWFNRIETAEYIKDFLLGEKPWSSSKIHERLSSISPIVTGAYIIKTPDGMNKLNGVLWCIDEFIKLAKDKKEYFQNLYKGGYSTQTACELLKQSPFLGGFTSYQICADAQYTCLLENSPDINEWAQPGPGSSRGLGRIFYNDPDHFNYGSMADQDEMIILMRDLLEHSKDVSYWPYNEVQWLMQTVQNWCCEYSKYCSAAEGKRLKRKYG